MKPLLTLFLLFTLNTLKAQPAITITMVGIGEIKVGMKKADLEKLIGTPIKIKNLLKKEPERDTVNFTYKGIPIQVLLDKSFLADNVSDIVVWEVKSSSSNLKTKSGIGIGEDKLKIITTYEGYAIYLMPEYENNYTVKSKTKSTVTLRGDESGNVIIFFLTNNKVTAISVTYEEGC